MLWGRGSSYMGHPFVLAPFVEETILFPMKLFWHICQNSAGHRSKGIFLVPWFCSLFYISVLMKIPHCLDYYSFVVSFEIEMHGSSNFVLHFQKKKCLVILGSLHLYTDLRICLSIYAKKVRWDFEKDCVESADQFGIWPC
jgi:hypothetical protein